MSERDDDEYENRNLHKKRNLAYEQDENRKKKKNDVQLSGKVDVAPLYDLVFPSRASSDISLKEKANFFKEVCLLCLDSDKFSSFKVMSCGHRFHPLCIQTLCQNDEICPDCMPDKMVDNNTWFGPHLENLYRSDVSEENISIVSKDKEYVCELSDEVRCSICLDTENYSNFETISCSHSFHVLCIQRWSTIKKTCPTCMINNPSTLFQDSAAYEFSGEVACSVCMDTKVFSEFEENKSCPICMKGTSESNMSPSLEMENEEGYLCAICMDTDTETDAFEFLPCCHSFHVGCIQTWIKKGNACPICSFPISGKMHTFEAQDASEYENEDEDSLENYFQFYDEEYPDSIS